MPPLITFSMNIPVDVNREGEMYISCCPPLDVYSQGSTEDEAIRNLIEACQVFVESCFERGTLEQVLKDCGFSPTRKKPVQNNKMRHLDVPLSLVANNAQNCAC